MNSQLCLGQAAALLVPRRCEKGPVGWL